MSNEARVTVRVKSELYKQYQIYLIKNDLTMKDDLNKHIDNQVKGYRIPLATAPVDYDNLEYTKANFAVPEAQYKEYKIILKENNTTPTADIVRYMMSVV